MTAHRSHLIYPAPGLFGGRRPILTLFDLDRAAKQSGEITPFFERIARTLERTRRVKLPVAHFFMKDSEAAFLPENCRPHASEMVFERRTLSCLTSEYFLQMLNGQHEQRIVMAGVGVNAALASLADAKDMGIEAHLLTDHVHPAQDGSELFDTGAAIHLLEEAGLGVHAENWPYSLQSMPFGEAV